MSPETIAATLDRVAADFLATQGPRVTDPVRAREWCVERSTEFVEALLAEGIAAQTISGVEVGEMPEFPGVELILSGHTAALVCLGDPADPDSPDVVYDWTARQFDPTCPVPLIQPVEEWRSRWRSVGQWAGTDA